jgi:E3 ubiquitin-protein ligase SHPRH
MAGYRFSYFLIILENAFKQHRIGYTSITKPNGIKTFKEDPSIEAFVLYARSHSSGLNLVNANHVFLCEPLLNTALELQAIARIDRIGQQQETTVWLYLIDGTVEESIYNLSLRRRIEHLGRVTKGKSQETTAEQLDMANALEMEQAPQLSRLIRKDGIGGEVIDKRDVWQCLFGQNPEPSQSGPSTQGVWSSMPGEAEES